MLYMAEPLAAQIYADFVNIPTVLPSGEIAVKTKPIANAIGLYYDLGLIYSIVSLK